MSYTSRIVKQILSLKARYLHLEPNRKSLINLLNETETAE